MFSQRLGPSIVAHDQVSSLVEVIGKAARDANPGVRSAARVAATALLAADMKGELSSSVGFGAICTISASVPAGVDLKAFDACAVAAIPQLPKNRMSSSKSHQHKKPASM